MNQENLTVQQDVLEEKLVQVNRVAKVVKRKNFRIYSSNGRWGWKRKGRIWKR